jgi:hypothetical protein
MLSCPAWGVMSSKEVSDRRMESARGAQLASLSQKTELTIVFFRSSSLPPCTSQNKSEPSSQSRQPRTSTRQ